VTSLGCTTEDATYTISGAYVGQSEEEAHQSLIKNFNYLESSVLSEDVLGYRCYISNSQKDSALIVRSTNGKVSGLSYDKGTADEVTESIQQLEEEYEQAQEDTSTESSDSQLASDDSEDSYDYDDDTDDDYYDDAYDDSDEYIFPNSDSVKLKKKDLKGLTAQELRIGRNEIYARHGRLFQDEELQEYFNQQSWYDGYIEPEDFVDSEYLSDIERYNANFILKFE
jgi:hypothetical protein